MENGILYVAKSVFCVASSFLGGGIENSTAKETSGWLSFPL